MSTPISVVPASAEVKLSSDYSCSSRLRVDLPTFNGKSTAWYSFWTLFSAIIKEQKISSTEKTCHLIQAMESEEAKTLATQAAGNEMDFDYVVDILREHYERGNETSSLNTFNLWLQNARRDTIITIFLLSLHKSKPIVEA